MAFLVTLVQLVLLIPTAVIGLVLHVLTSLLDSALLVVARASTSTLQPELSRLTLHTSLWQWCWVGASECARPSAW
jgi:hypothetical protein